MPRLSSKLISTERAVELVKPKGKRTEHRVAGLRGLVLRVSDTGIKTWVYNFKSPVTQKWRKKSFGSFPTISLAAAKDLALDCMNEVRSGTDPLYEPPRTEVTFKKLSDEYREAHRGRHAASWAEEIERVLEVDILPALNGHRVGGVTRLDVARVVERVAERGAFASANLVLKVMRGIFRWALRTGRCEMDPTAGATTYPSKPRARLLTDCEVRAVWSTTTEFRDALRLQLVLGARIGEVLGARKSEFDLVERTWTIPAGRTKSKRQHQLPLAPLAIDIIKSVMERAGGSQWLFPSRKDNGALRPVSAAQALLRLTQHMGMGIEDRFTSHDLRRSCASRLGDMGVPDEVIGRILSHAPVTVTGRHYNHARRFEEMRTALEAWATQLTTIVEGQ